MDIDYAKLAQAKELRDTLQKEAPLLNWSVFLADEIDQDYFDFIIRGKLVICGKRLYVECEITQDMLDGCHMSPTAYIRETVGKKLGKALTGF